MCRNYGLYEAKRGVREDIVRLVLDGGVLVELVGGVYFVAVGLVLHAAVANVVVIPSVEPGAVHHIANQLAAVVVVEHVVAGGTLPRERAGSRAAQRIVLVGAACYAAAVCGGAVA